MEKVKVTQVIAREEFVVPLSRPVEKSDSLGDAPDHAGPVAILPDASLAWPELFAMAAARSSELRDLHGRDSFLLLGADASAACGLHAFMPPAGARLPNLVLDDFWRNRSHSLGAPECAHNASAWGASFRLFLDRWKAAGARLAIRLRAGDDRLYPAFAPPQTAALAGDLLMARELGIDELQYVSHATLPGRLDLNRAVLERLASGGPEGLGSAALRDEICLSACGGRKDAAAGLSSMYRDLEDSWKMTLERHPGDEARIDEAMVFLPPGWAFGAEGPRRLAAAVLRKRLYPQPLNPWDESLERSAEAANAMDDAYALLDRAGEGLSQAISAAEASGDADFISFMETERRVFAAQEAAIELSGVLRALYAEFLSPAGAPAPLGMFAEVALHGLERKLRQAISSKDGLKEALARLEAGWGFPIGKHLRDSSRGLGRFKAWVRETRRSIRYSTLI